MGDFDELRAAWTGLVETMDPLAEPEIEFPNGLGCDEDIIAGLFEIFSGDAEKAEAFGGEFEQAICLDSWTTEECRAAIFGIVAVLMFQFDMLKIMSALK